MLGVTLAFNHSRYEKTTGLRAVSEGLCRTNALENVVFFYDDLPACYESTVY